MPYWRVDGASRGVIVVRARVSLDSGVGAPKPSSKEVVVILLIGGAIVAGVVAQLSPERRYLGCVFGRCQKYFFSFGEQPRRATCMGR